jgi:hypothetical protein
MTVSIDKKYVTRNGEYDAKVVSTRNVDCYQKGVLPVVAELEHKSTKKVRTIQCTFNGQFLSFDTHPLDLIEVPEASEDEQDGWIEFDAENDEVPFLHMHDMLEVKHKDYNSHWKLMQLPAWSVDFNGSRYPVTAYRLVKKAEVKS